MNNEKSWFEELQVGDEVLVHNGLTHRCISSVTHRTTQFVTVDGTRYNCKLHEAGCDRRSRSYIQRLTAADRAHIMQRIRRARALRWIRDLKFENIETDILERWRAEIDHYET